MTELVTRVEVASIAAGGDGVGRTDGMVVFTPRTAPGDVAQVALRPAKRFARGRLVSLDTASTLRVTPACEHYVVDRCGGCQLQHLSYEAQLSAKGAIIGDTLRRIGKRELVDPVVEPSDDQWRYRQKLTLHLRRVGGHWIAGLHPHDDPVAVFDLHDCPITDARVMAVWTELRPAFVHLPAVPALRVSVRLLSDGASVVVSGGDAWRSPERVFAAAPSITQLWWKSDTGKPRLVAERAGSAAAGAAFAQVNAAVAARLHAHVLERTSSYSPSRVVDAYAGTGATAIPLAASGCAVTAIEWDHDAVASLGERLRPPSRVLGGRVEDHLSGALPADVVLLNPPRTGVDARVTHALERVRIRPRAVIYVSCDPATLARDLARLASYRLMSVRAYDMFPQTAHVETVCELVPVTA